MPPVITSNTFRKLLPMLVGGRYDFFPRVLYEVRVEKESFNQYQIAVEENILLAYPFVLYFFVSLDIEMLAQQIEDGSERAIDDGSYEQLFFSNPMIKYAPSKANLKERKIFHLTNSNLPKGTPLSVRKYWLDVYD